jgi:nucleoside-diphosphate-sugar epimerase
MAQPLDIFITGGTGYVGQRLIAALLARGHRVRALARQSSTGRVAAGASAVVGDALDTESVAAAIKLGDTIVHLVGTPHPSPAKAKEFQQVDLPSIRATVAAAQRVKISHLVYVSIAQPAPVMRAYLEVRAAGEAMIREAKLTATILRPWYILGPGHWWPLALLPIYKITELLPSTREGAQRLGLVTIKQMVQALVAAVENPPAQGQVRIVDVPAIRRGGGD